MLCNIIFSPLTAQVLLLKAAALALSRSDPDADVRAIL